MSNGGMGQGAEELFSVKDSSEVTSVAASESEVASSEVWGRGS
jgi:hypothetical protein